MSGAAEGVLAPGRRTVTIGIVLGISAVGFEALGVSTAMPVVARALHGESLYGWAFSAFLLGQLIGIVSAGADADARGPKRAYVLALIAFAFGLSICGASRSMPLLVAGRFVAGIEQWHRTRRATDRQSDGEGDQR